MKINFIGTGTMGSVTRGNQSILLDDILIDVGSGVVKSMEAKKMYTKNVRYLLLTHVHSDHFVDLPNLLIGRSIRKEDNEILKIICHKGMKQKIIDLFELCFGNGTNLKYSKFEEGFNVEIIELEDDETFLTNNFKLTAYKLEHGDCKSILGYTIEKENKCIGYATDTTLCDGVREICKKSDIALLDATNIERTNSHMGLKDVQMLQKEYPNCKVYAIHRSDYNHENIDKIEFPEDGDIIEL